MGAGCQSTERCELGRKEAGPHGRAGSPQSLEQIMLRKGPWLVCPALGGQHLPLYPRDGDGDLGVKWLIIIPLKHRLMLFAWICTSTLLQCRLAGLCVVEKMLRDLNILDHPADIFLIFSTLVCPLAQHLTGDRESVLLEFSELWISYHDHRQNFSINSAFAHHSWHQALAVHLADVISVYDSCTRLEPRLQMRKARLGGFESLGFSENAILRRRPWAMRLCQGKAEALLNSQQRKPLLFETTCLIFASLFCHPIF